MEQRNKDLTHIKRDPMYQMSKSIMGMNISPFMYEHALELNGQNVTKVKHLIQGEGGEKKPNSYLESEQSYEDTKARLQNSNISYIKSDLLCLRTNLQRIKSNLGFDKIYLSNVPEYFNGDFDPEGLLIAQNLKNKYPNIKFIGYNDKFYLNGISDNTINDSRLKKLNNISDDDLVVIKELLLENKVSSYQELNYDMILDMMNSL